MFAVFERVPLFLAFVAGALVGSTTVEMSFAYLGWTLVAAFVWVLSEVTYARVIRKIVRRVVEQFPINASGS